MVSAPAEAASKPAAPTPGTSSVPERTVPPQASTGPPSAGPPSPGAPNPGLPKVDLADIRPLDSAGAFQILVAEVREALEHSLLEALRAADAGGGNLQGAGDSATANPVEVGNHAALVEWEGPMPAARALVEVILRALPDIADERLWGAAAEAAEAALRTGAERALDAIGAWRDVAPFVVEAARDSAELAMTILANEQLDPTYLRPEWRLMPRLMRYRRRRRAFERRVSDPDSTGWTEENGPADDNGPGHGGGVENDDGTVRHGP